MHWLKITITFKIIVTIILWVIPSLFFSQKLSQSFGFPKLEPMIFIRLLGMAFTALCVGYVFGLGEIAAGRFPLTTVWVGLVSNAGAALLLAIYGIGGQWRDWGFPARMLMWISLFALSLISLGLFWFGIYEHYF